MLSSTPSKGGWGRPCRCAPTRGAMTARRDTYAWKCRLAGYAEAMNLLHQVAWDEGFAKHTNVLRQIVLLGEYRGRMARRKEDLEVRMDALRFRRELRAIHSPRHRDVGKENTDRGVLIEDGQRFSRLGGHNHVKAKSGQKIGGAIPNVRVVLDEQHLSLSGHHIVSFRIGDHDFVDWRFQASRQIHLDRSARTSPNPPACPQD